MFCTMILRQAGLLSLVEPTDDMEEYTAHFMLGLLFGPEDGGDTFLENVGGNLSNYRVLQPQRLSQMWELQRREFL